MNVNELRVRLEDLSARAEGYLASGDPESIEVGYSDAQDLLVDAEEIMDELHAIMDRARMISIQLRAAYLKEPKQDA